MTTKHLQTMDREGRVLVTRFAYSSMKTIPKVILTSTLVKKTNPKILPNVKSHVWPYGHGDKAYNGSHFTGCSIKKDIK